MTFLKTLKNYAVKKVLQWDNPVVTNIWLRVFGPQDILVPVVQRSNSPKR